MFRYIEKIKTFDWNNSTEHLQTTFKILDWFLISEPTCIKIFNCAFRTAASIVPEKRGNRSHSNNITVVVRVCMMEEFR